MSHRIFVVLAAAAVGIACRSTAVERAPEIVQPGAPGQSSKVVAAAKAAAGGSLEKVEVLKVLGMVNAVPGFGDQPKVINGCSDLFVNVLGERGRHAAEEVHRRIDVRLVPEGVAEDGVRDHDRETRPGRLSHDSSEEIEVHRAGLPAAASRATGAHPYLGGVTSRPRGAVAGRTIGGGASRSMPRSRRSA